MEMYSKGHSCSSFSHDDDDLYLHSLSMKNSKDHYRVYINTLLTYVPIYGAHHMNKELVFIRLND